MAQATDSGGKSIPDGTIRFESSSCMHWLIQILFERLRDWPRNPQASSETPINLSVSRQSS